MRLVACPSCHVQYDVTASARARWACACGAVIENVTPVGKDADVRRCGACGAAIESGATACVYCRASLVLDRTRLRLVCPECWVRNDERSRFCTSCGVRFDPQPLPADGAAAKGLTCPGCAAELRGQGIGGVAVHECPACAGLWVPGDRFDALVEGARQRAEEKPSSGVERPRAIPRHAVAGPVCYRDCPVCAQPMHRRNFARRSGILLDVCGEHGTWLDARELEAIAQFILAGGLAEAHRRAAAETAREAAMTAEERHAWMLAQTGSVVSPSGADWIGGSLGALLKVLMQRGR